MFFTEFTGYSSKFVVKRTLSLFKMSKLKDLFIKKDVQGLTAKQVKVHKVCFDIFDSFDFLINVVTFNSELGKQEILTSSTTYCSASTNREYI